MAYRAPMTRGANRAKPGASLVWLAHLRRVGPAGWCQVRRSLFNDYVKVGRLLPMVAPIREGRRFPDARDRTT